MQGRTIFCALAFAAFAAGADAAAAPDDLIPPGATKLVDTGNVTEFDVAMAPVEIDDFYRKVLPDQGWNVTDDVLTPTSISFYFSRGADGEGSVVIRLRGDVSHVVLTLTE